MGALADGLANELAPTAASKIAYLEAVRGLAAVQVMLLHVATAYAPALSDRNISEGFLAAVHRSPLFFLYDGHSAVFVFFILSGVVLTLAFRQQIGAPMSWIGGRAVRLVLPVVVIGAMAFVLNVLAGDANQAAGKLTGSNWLSVLWHPELTASAFLKDTVLNALVLGYPSTSVFPHVGLAGLLTPHEASFNFPLWTLSIEFYGSILIVILCQLTRLHRILQVVLLGLLTIVFARSVFICFIAGHALAISGVIERPRTSGRLALALAAIGISLCLFAEGGDLSFFTAVCAASVPGVIPCGLSLQKIYGGMAVFAAVVWSARAKSVLSTPVLVWLGRISFSLYLVHAPILFGLSTLVFLSAAGTIGVGPAAALASGFAIVTSLGVATAFVPVDRWAVSMSRLVRHRLRGAAF